MEKGSPSLRVQEVLPRIQTGVFSEQETPNFFQTAIPGLKLVQLPHASWMVSRGRGVKVSTLY